MLRDDEPLIERILAEVRAGLEQIFTGSGYGCVKSTVTDKGETALVEVSEKKRITT